MTTHEKNIVMAVFGALIEKSYSSLNTFLGSVTIREMVSMYHRLQYEDLCREYGKDYDDMTSDDWTQLYEMVIDPIVTG